MNDDEVSGYFSLFSYFWVAVAVCIVMGYCTSVTFIVSERISVIRDVQSRCMYVRTYFFLDFRHA